MSELASTEIGGQIVSGPDEAGRRRARYRRAGAIGGRIVGKFVATLVAASVVTFTIFHVFLDPINLILPLSAGRAARAALRHQLGLDMSLWSQYFHWIAHAVHGNFGNSIELRAPALPAALQALGATAEIVVPAVVIGTVVGTMLGLVAARREGSLVDRLVSSGSYGLLSLHDVWVSIMLMLIFAVTLGVVPAGGRGGVTSFILPIAALSIRPVGQISQLMRSALIEEGNRPYARTAVAKGVRARRLLLVHQMKGAIPLVATYAMYDFGRLFVAGAIIVETVFSWPGIGALTVQTLTTGDIYLSQVIVLIDAVIVASLNLFADVLQLWIDPRLRA